MSHLGTAIAIASKAHLGQFDKGGYPYILHPLKVMHYCHTEDPEIQMIAVLHDVVEDTVVTLQDLRTERFSQRVIDGVDAMTKRENEPINSYVSRVMTNDDAVIVKMADLRHNTDVRRLKGLTKRDMNRMETYQRLYEKLKKHRIISKL
jgi:(p)ppGpp synthase/HD superfamily hydrolase